MKITSLIDCKGCTLFVQENGEKLDLFVSATDNNIDLSKEKFSIIEAGSFRNVSGIESIKLPISVHIIKESAFENCSDLRTIQFLNNSKNDSVSKELIIQSNAFENCTNLDSVILKSNKIIIEKDAFLGCDKLRAVCLGCDEIELRQGAFCNFSQVTIILSCQKMNKTSKEKIQEYCAKNNISLKVV